MKSPAFAGLGKPGWWLDATLIFLLAAVLIWPMFKVRYFDSWGSIESTFISDARFLRDQGFTAQWQPNWYCGTRWQYIYPPALRYGTALLATYPNMTPARGYHIYIAFFYSLGIMGVYLLWRTGHGSRLWAWVVAAAAATISPAYLFIADVRGDANLVSLPPQRLNALMRYGEGPHITSVALLGLALALAWRGLLPGNRRSLAGAAVCSALVVANNFYGATSLAILFPALVWALWVTHQDHWMLARAAAIAGLAYGLCAFWFSPSYFFLTLYNMRHVSAPGSASSRLIALGCAVVFCALTWFFLRRRAKHAWAVFVAGAAGFLSLNVLGNATFNFRVLGEPSRMIPELDMALIFLAALGLAWLGRQPRVPKAIVVVLVVLCFGLGARRYLRDSRALFLNGGDHRDRIEYRLTDWIARNIPGTRVMATGSVRFWFNAWYDIPQLGGGSEQGVLNQNVVPAQWQIMLGENPQLGVLWMQALATGAVAVHDKQSQEFYKDFPNPKKFEGVLEAIWDSGQGDRIYRVPRRYPALARVVDIGRSRALTTPASDGDEAALRAYVEVIENGPAAEVQLRRVSNEEVVLAARREPGQALLFQESWDPAWRAYADGAPVAIEPDALGFQRVLAPPGDAPVRLVYEPPFETRVGQAASLISILLTGALLFRRRARAA
jgi:hypothetical protein